MMLISNLDQRDPRSQYDERFILTKDIVVAVVFKWIGRWGKFDQDKTVEFQP